MAYSTQSTVSDGSLVLLDISLEYFDRTEIAVLFDGVVDVYPWEWVGSTEKKVSFDPAVPDGVEVRLVRTTDLSDVRHVFTLGAAFTTESLDEDLRQVLHIAQEARENATIEEVFTDLNLHGYRVRNLGPGVDPLDASNMAQLTVHDSTIVGYRDQTETYKNQAAASAAAALASENATAAEVATHAGGTAVHSIAGVSGLQASLDSKQATLVSTTNIKTINGDSVLGSGDLVVSPALVDGSVTPAKLAQPLTLSATVTASGTSVDFTGIPAWVRRITVSFGAVSLSGTASLAIQIGDTGGVETTGYDAGSNFVSTGAGAPLYSTTRFPLNGNNVVAHTETYSGSVVLALLDPSTNTWCIHGNLSRVASAGVSSCAGQKSLSATLDRVRVTSTNDSDSFDGGKINILYEG